LFCDDFGKILDFLPQFWFCESLFAHKIVGNRQIYKKLFYIWKHEGVIKKTKSWCGNVVHKAALLKSKSVFSSGFMVYKSTEVTIPLSSKTIFQAAVSWE
jgi:hypothetical protein